MAGGPGPSAWAGQVSKFPGLVSMPGCRELTAGRLYFRFVDEIEYDLAIVPWSFGFVELRSTVRDLGTKLIIWNKF
jgi:hypothetical protein